MSEKVWRYLFQPLSGDIEFQRINKVSLAGGTGGGTVTQGVLVFPGGVTFEVTEGIASTGTSEIVLAPNSEIVVIT